MREKEGDETCVRAIYRRIFRNLFMLSSPSSSSSSPLMILNIHFFGAYTGAFLQSSVCRALSIRLSLCALNFFSSLTHSVDNALEFGIMSIEG